MFQHRRLKIKKCNQLTEFIPVPLAAVLLDMADDAINGTMLTMSVIAISIDTDDAKVPGWTRSRNAENRQPTLLPVNGSVTCV